jgi:hypothetical protein
MRRPTPQSKQLEWWNGHQGSIITSEFPQCGYFKTRSAPRSKIWLPAKVSLHQEIDWETGELTEPERFTLTILDRTWSDQEIVMHKWLFLRPVPLPEWKWLQARHALQNGSGQTQYTYG